MPCLSRTGVSCDNGCGGENMLNNKRGNVFVVAVVVLVTVAVIMGACLLVFGEYLIPLIQDAAPYSYLTVLVVVLAAIFFLA